MTSFDSEPTSLVKNPPEKSQPDKGAPDRTVQPDGAARLRSPEAPPRILMAEDNPINQRVAKLILQRAGFSIDLVGNGLEAKDAHQARSYDVILMDCQMPTMDGFEASRQIRALDQPQPVIIAVTANALAGEREKCLGAGMDDYLSKPFQAEQLVSVVKKWLANRAAERR